MKLPSFQFYPGDWVKDPNLRRCSKAAKGFFIDMLCLMFECEDRGVLMTDGRPWLDQEIAEAVLGDTAENLSCLHELLDKGVVSRNQSGAIFSRRMVRDEKIRAMRSKAGKLGAPFGKLGGRPKTAKTAKPTAKLTAKKPLRQRQKNPPSSSSSSLDGSAIADPIAEFTNVNSALAGNCCSRRQFLWSKKSGWMYIAQEDRDRWKKAFPSCDIDRQLAAMDTWLRTSPYRVKNWENFVTRWFLRAKNHGGYTPTAGSNGQDANVSRVHAQPGKYERAMRERRLSQQNP